MDLNDKFCRADAVRSLGGMCVCGCDANCFLWERGAGVMQMDAHTGRRLALPLKLQAGVWPCLYTRPLACARSQPPPWSQQEPVLPIGAQDSPPQLRHIQLPDVHRVLRVHRLLRQLHFLWQPPTHILRSFRFLHNWGGGLTWLCCMTPFIFPRPTHRSSASSTKMRRQ